MSIFRTIRERAETGSELLRFLWARKQWWLIPLVVFLLLFSALIVFAQSSAVAPFIYTLF